MVDQTYPKLGNTLNGRSKVPLHKWLYAMYLLVTAHFTFA